MSFRLSDDQVALQGAVERFLGDAMAGGLRRRAFDGADGFDPAFWDGLMALGVGGLGLAPKFGGLGLETIDLALVAESLGYEAAPGPFLGHILAGLAIQIGGSAAQQARWLPRLAVGEVIGGVALGEAGDRWAPEQWTLQPQDRRLSGCKAHVLYPELAQVMVVGLAGGGLGLVDCEGPGLRVSALDGVDRTRRMGIVDFDAVAVEPLNADPDAGRKLYDRLLVLLAADAFGGARRCLDLTTDYVKTRQQFGGPIGRFQGIKHRLANMASDVEPARGLVWYAAMLADQGNPDAARVACLAKAHLADRFNGAARTAVELHGGIGVTWDYDLQVWVKRAMFDLAYGGVPAVLRRRAAAHDR